ncbi:aminopeptidase P family protein [Rhodosalinus sp. FB01]|uniref:aminopeptidase P family protein n=1 Tax=Rhodosalinus sp. FB01 TaxID=3239194 RepID=UPI003525FE48
MLQSFKATSRPDQGPPRLARLREEMAREGLDGFWVPRADAHQGEYVAPRDERLSWLTGFTGSAGFAVVLASVAGVFVDGRYRVQVKAQVAEDFTPVDWPEVKPSDWLRETLPNGGVVGIDPWLHTVEQVEKLETALRGSGVSLRETANLVDRIWQDQPAPPLGRARAHPLDLAGEGAAEKRARLGRELRDAGHRAAVITLPDSICWLLNIRGSDVPRAPLAHGFAVLHEDGRVDLFMAEEKLEGLGDHLGPEVAAHRPERFAAALGELSGPVRIDPASAPLAVLRALEEAGVEVARGPDPCVRPKACKNAAEIRGAGEAHLRDGAAVCEFLAWLADQPAGSLTEIEAVTKLEESRRATGKLEDISFDTISCAGPHGAIMHYRVTEETNRPLKAGELYLVDSGGQYLDGTTDITRTVAIGTPTEEMRACYTRVLQGLITLSRLRWPAGLAGRDLDALARMPLWLAGQDYAHGTGHGVGAYLSVHEGPQKIARAGEAELLPGMILSNEPGFYREGAFGIRLENLIVVEDAPELPGGSVAKMLRFHTLTYVPFERRLVEAEMLHGPERAWLNAYHALVRSKIGPRLGSAAKTWLDAATAPI